MKQDAVNRDLLDRLSDGFALVSADGTLDYYNPVFSQLLGFPAELPIETRLLGVEQVEACRPFADALKSALSGEHQVVQFVLTNEQDHRRFLECAATAVPEGPNQFKVVLVIRDQTEREQMRAQTQTDQSTGLFNRDHLMELAEREYQRTRRRRSPLIVLMIAVDQFKPVNDASGHAAGEHALRAVAQMLREQIRSFDLVGRYGGDEFVVLLVDCTHAYAFEIIRRLHQAAQIIRVLPDASRVTISLSIGMAACRFTEKETLERVLAEAEREMRAVKNRAE